MNSDPEVQTYQFFVITLYLPLEVMVYDESKFERMNKYTEYFM